MYINKKLLLFLLLLTIGSVGFAVVSSAQNNAPNNAAANVPGSADDPLITKSYVDEQVAALVNAELEKLQAAFDKKMNEQLLKIGTEFKTANANELNKLRQSMKNPAVELITVTVKPGQMMIANAGSEFIVRSGRASLFSPDKNGASNLTIGRDVAPGTIVPNNQLILFPKEGRGLVNSATAKTDLIVLTRGGHQLKKQPK
jgi:hypothetical protein